MIDTSVRYVVRRARGRVVGATALLCTAALLAACSGGGGGSSSSSASSSVSSNNSAKLGDASTAGDGQGDVYTPSGPLVSDTGFRPDKNGLPFPNYGNDPAAFPALGGQPAQNLTAAEMKGLLGPSVCADPSAPTCSLIPPAQQLMDHWNAGLDGGHCYGFTVTSQLLFGGALKPSDFGAAAVGAVQLGSNAAIQHELALNATKQYMPWIQALTVTGTPNEILDKLTADLSAGNKDNVYSLNIFKTDPQTGGRTGGHSVAPYAIEDKGNGQFAVLIYDNNYPGVVHAIIFDRNANTWTYTTTTVPGVPPDVYAGDANTKSIDLGVIPTNYNVPGCPFCAKDPGAATGSTAGGAGSAAGVGHFNEYVLDGGKTEHGHLLFTDPQGRHYGYFNGKWVTEIPGITSSTPTGDDSYLKPEPVYDVPDTLKVDVTIDGSGLTKPDTESLTMVGPGIDLSIDEINLQPGDTDQLAAASDGSELQYTSGRTESPIFSMGAVDANADYSFAVKGLDLAQGEVVDFKLDDTNFTIDATNAQATGTYGVVMIREDHNGGQQEFDHDSITLDPGETAQLEYSNFSADGQGVPLHLIHKDGSQETQQLTDQNNPANTTTTTP